MRVSIGLCAGLLLLAGCAAPTARNQAADAIQREMNQAVQDNVKPSRVDEVNNALLPPLAMILPKAGIKPTETKFDLTVNNTPVSQVFTAIVSGTRYSMLLHPDVSGSVSLNLKDVTVLEALEAIREMYGYDYKLDGSRIYIQPLSLQTRIYQVSYLTGQRQGSSSLRVSGGSVADVVSGSSAGASSSSRQDNSKVTTTSSTDFWDELSKSLTAIVGCDQPDVRGDRGARHAGRTEEYFRLSQGIADFHRAAGDSGSQDC